MNNTGAERKLLVCRFWDAWIWVYNHDLERRWEPSQWKSPALSHQDKVHKVILTIFSDYQGVEHLEYALQGYSVKHHFYLQVLRCLFNVVQNELQQM